MEILAKTDKIDNDILAYISPQYMFLSVWLQKSVDFYVIISYHFLFLLHKSQMENITNEILVCHGKAISNSYAN